jgi:hypothetical protein
MRCCSIVDDLATGVVADRYQARYRRLTWRKRTLDMGSGMALPGRSLSHANGMGSANLYGRNRQHYIGARVEASDARQVIPYILARRVNASRAPSNILHAASRAAVSSIDPRATILL